MTASKIMAKRAAAGTLALAVCLTGGLVSAGAANAAAGFKFDTRIAGDDRYATAVAASKAAFPTTAGSIVLTNGLSEVDGLTASYVAGLHSASILYTSGPTNIAANTQAEITRLSAKTIYIVGGTTVVSAALEAQLKTTYGDANVIRYGGADRYETAAKVAQSGTTKPGKVIVANGASYADALVAGPVAYAKKYPILLTASTGVPAFTSEALKNLAVDTVDVIGGTAVVSDTTYSAVGGDIRLGGETRQSTAIQVANEAIKSEGFKADSVALVGNTNANAADALVAAPLAGINGVPLLFIDNNDAAKPTNTYLTSKFASLTGKGYVFGGTTAVPQAAVDAATSAASTVTGVATFGITAGDTVVTSTTGTRTYTVDGLTAGTAVNIALVAPTAVSGSTFTTLDASKRFAALTPASNATITAVNGVTIAGVSGLTFTPTTTSVTFTVTASAATSLVPVVYSAADGNTTLSVNLAGTAKELAGIGGKVTFQAAASVAPAESAAAQAHVATNLVSAVYGTTGFSAATEAGQYLLRDGDTYQLGGGSITKAQFLSILSPGDAVAAVTSYSQGTVANTWNITADAMPTAATIAPAATVSGTTLGQVSVSYASDTEFAAGSTSYALQRRQVVAGSTTPVSGTAGNYTTVDTRTVTTAGTQTFVETLPAGSYQYQVVASAPSFSGTAAVTSTASAEVPVVTSSTLAAPVLQRLYLTSNATSINALNAGDSFKVVLTQPINAPAVGANLTVGTQVLTAATSGTATGTATFSINSGAEVVDGVSQAAGTVLTVTLLGDPGAAVALTTDPTTTALLSASSGIGNSVGTLTLGAATNRALTRDVVS